MPSDECERQYIDVKNRDRSRLDDRCKKAYEWFDHGLAIANKKKAKDDENKAKKRA